MGIDEVDGEVIFRPHDFSIKFARSPFRHLFDQAIALLGEEFGELLLQFFLLGFRLLRESGRIETVNLAVVGGNV